MCVRRTALCALRRIRADPVAAAGRVLETVRAAAGTDLSVLDADAARTLVRTVGQVESAVAVWKAEAISAAQAAGAPERDGARDGTGWVKDQLGSSGRQAKKDTALASGKAPTSGGVRPHIMVHMTADDLAAGSGGLAIGGSGQTMSGRAGRRIACDATLRRVVSDGDSKILDVGRAVRTWPPAIRAAIHARDGH